jgi:hypothetical protein
MVHPLATQLRFARSEFRRALDGVTAEEAQRRLLPINSISWMVGHLAWQEQRYWIYRPEGRYAVPELNDLVGFGAPASTPPLADMWAAWETVTREADPFLDSLTPETLATHFEVDGQTDPESIGTRLLRTTYHYWYHIGESQAVRQLLGHADVGNFVGNIGSEAPWIAAPS